MIPASEPSFAVACARACPGFSADGEVWRARKSELLWGHVDGRSVVAKRLVRPTAVWTWYFAREVALYRAFEAQPPAVPLPRLVGAADGILVIERLPGEPIATRRHPHAELTAADVAALVDYRARLAAWTGPVPLASPPARVRSQLRERLLEDPTAPVAWVRDGVARCARRGILDTGAAARIDDALAAHAPVAFGHGDVLLRNAIRDGDSIALCDWECAGPHVYDWDLALLWSQLAVDAREPLEDVARETPARWRSFVGLAAFALAREIRFLVGFGVANDHGELARLRGELAELVTRA
jgi:hypothetical protein